MKMFSAHKPFWKIIHCHPINGRFINLRIHNMAFCIFCYFRRCMKSNMHVLRSALSACVMTDLEDVESYVLMNQNHRLCKNSRQNADYRQYVRNVCDSGLNENGGTSEVENARRQQHANWIILICLHV